MLEVERGEGKTGLRLRDGGLCRGERGAVGGEARLGGVELRLGDAARIGRFQAAEVAFGAVYRGLALGDLAAGLRDSALATPSAAT